MMTQWHGTKRVFVCGTRAVVAGPTEWRVVCATCGGGGTVRYDAFGKATEACVRDSAKPCPVQPHLCRL